MSIKQTGVVAHDTTCNLAEMTRQTAVAAASTQAAVNAAEVIFHRACATSSRLNNSSSDIGVHLQALRALGVNS